MSENPANQNQETADAEQVEAIARYLSASRELTERLQLLREGVHETLNDQFQIVAGDLEQLRGLLGDAAQKLSATFRVITAGTTEWEASSRPPWATRPPPSSDSARSPAT